MGLDPASRRAEPGLGLPCNGFRGAGPWGPGRRTGARLWRLGPGNACVSSLSLVFFLVLVLFFVLPVVLFLVLNFVKSGAKFRQSWC